MTTKGNVMRASAALAIAFATMLALAATAWADGVSAWGAQTHLQQPAAAGEQVRLQAVDFQGAEGETVYLTVMNGATEVAKFLPHQLGEGLAADESTDADPTDVFALEAPNDDALLNGSYTVQVLVNRAGDSLYEGTIYGVYASIDGELYLIGSRTGTDAAYQAPETLYLQDEPYALQGAAETPGAAGTLAFAYAKEETTESAVDGTVSFVDSDGNLVATASIPNIPYNGSKQYSIPSAVTGDDGLVYRTLSLNSSVTASNPGSTAITISCVKMSSAAATASGHYLAVINLVDQDGTVIASDSVNVTGQFRYTAPSAIYKTMEVDGKQRSVAYSLDGGQEQTITLRADADRNLVAAGQRVVNIPYTRGDLEPLEVKVTFNLLNGQERAQSSNKARSLGVQQVVVNAENATAEPSRSVTVDGETYNLAGNPSDYRYEYGSGADPVVNAYYVPQGYEAPGPYAVTISYVNVANNQVVASETFESSPDSTGDATFTAPAEFMEDGTTYVRLDGQSDAISHNYYSHNTVYTVYYRDRSDTLTSGTVVNTVRVVYDLPAQTANDNAAGGNDAAGNGGNGGNDNAAAGGGADAGDNAGGNVGDNANGPTDNAQLNQNGTYNVMDGSGNQTLTNNRGVDSNTERIEDEETPLASAEDIAALQEQGSGLPAWALPLGVLLVAAAGAGAWLALRRRNQNDGSRA